MKPTVITGALCVLMSIIIPRVSAFDFENGSAPEEIVIPDVIPTIFSNVNPNDATLVLRSTVIVTNAWFDAIAPYGETSVGVYSRIERRPPLERTNTNRNISILYASLRVLNSLYPKSTDLWRSQLIDVGLDPDDMSMDPATPIGIGNIAGLAVAAARENDGMNQLGNEVLLGKQDEIVYNRQPYSDYTQFKPANYPHRLNNPSKWQPAIVTSGNGIFRIQQFVTPQLALTMPYSYVDPQQFSSPQPFDSFHTNPGRYKKQVDEVLAASAAMTDYQKMLAELFDNKINSLGFSALFASISQGMTLEEFVWYDFLTNVAAFDTAIAIWQEKRRFNAVRPFTAIKYVYGDKPVTAWGGPYMGTVSDIPASSWQSYLPVADHPEYPSASASFCAAHAESSRLFLGTDMLGWSFPVSAGSSVIEPGFTPQEDMTISFNTWTEFEEICGNTRFWAGVHFKASIPAGQEIGNQIGKLAHQFLVDHIEGTAPEFAP